MERFRGHPQNLVRIGPLLTGNRDTQRIPLWILALDLRVLVEDPPRCLNQLAILRIVIAGHFVRVVPRPCVGSKEPGVQSYRRRRVGILGEPFAGGLLQFLPAGRCRREPVLGHTQVHETEFPAARWSSLARLPEGRCQSIESAQIALQEQRPGGCLDRSIFARLGSGGRERTAGGCE